MFSIWLGFSVEGFLRGAGVFRTFILWPEKQRQRQVEVGRVGRKLRTEGKQAFWRYFSWERARSDDHCSTWPGWHVLHVASRGEEMEEVWEERGSRERERMNVDMKEEEKRRVMLVRKGKGREREYRDILKMRKREEKARKVDKNGGKEKTESKCTIEKEEENMVIERRGKAGL